MPDHNGAMTMGEVIDAWNKDKQRIKELEADYKELARLRKAEAVDNLANERRIKELQARLDAVQKDFAGCMRTAAEDIEDWGAYASPYFQEKHGLSTDVQRYRNKADELEAALEVSDAT